MPGDDNFAGDGPGDGAGDGAGSTGGNGVSIPDLIGPLVLKWVSGNSWVVGDNLPAAVFLLIDSGQNPPAPVVLDSATEIVFLAVSSIDQTLGIVNGQAGKVTGTPGLVTYSWSTGDLSAAGPINCQARVTWPGFKATFPDSGYAQYTVTPSLG